MITNSTNSGVGLDSEKQRRRRTYLIDPTFQWKYAISISLTVFVVSSILSCMLFASLHDQARQRIIQPTAVQASASWMMLVYAVGFSLFTAGTVGFWVILYTHRVCGPLFVLNRHFRQLASGVMPKLRPLRRKDEFKDLFKSFTRAVDTIREDREAALSAVCTMQATARVDREADEKVFREAIQSVARQLDSLRKTLEDGLEAQQADATAQSARMGTGRSASIMPPKPATVGAA